VLTFAGSLRLELEQIYQAAHFAVYKEVVDCSLDWNFLQPNSTQKEPYLGISPSLIPIEGLHSFLPGFSIFALALVLPLRLVFRPSKHSFLV